MNILFVPRVVLGLFLHPWPGLSAGITGVPHNPDFECCIWVTFRSQQKMAWDLLLTSAHCAHSRDWPWRCWAVCVFVVLDLEFRSWQGICTIWAFTLELSPEVWFISLTKQRNLSFFLFPLETGWPLTYYIAEGHLELFTFRPPPPECWEYRRALPCLTL